MNGIRFFISLSFFAVVSAAKAQRLAGTVQDSATGVPLSGASVFINSSSIGVMTSDSGSFTIKPGQLAEFDLIVSYVGYQTASVHITNPAVLQTVQMVKKNNLLDEVAVIAADKNGWKKWGPLFKKFFIGTTGASRHCSIVHPDSIRFHYSKKHRLLSAFASTPVTVINKYLGYKIEFDLIRFDIDFNTERVVYNGFPLFSELPGSASKRKSWAKNRKEVYFGSFMHFLRTLHGGLLNQSSYEVRRVLQKDNAERTRVRLRTGNFDPATLTRLTNDSSYYYQRIRSEPDSLRYISADTLSDSQFVKRYDDQVQLNFDGMIYVVYRKKKQEKEYADQIMLATRNKNISGLVQLLHKPVLITKTGQYFLPENVFLDGYWGWSEKVANQLPVDYVDPGEDNPETEKGVITTAEPMKVYLNPGRAIPGN